LTLEKWVVPAKQCGSIISTGYTSWLRQHMAKNQVFAKQDRAVFPNLHCFVGTTENSAGMFSLVQMILKVSIFFQMGPPPEKR
jgi:hypothetical protein